MQRSWPGMLAFICLFFSTSSWSMEENVIQQTIRDLQTRYGHDSRQRIVLGVRQAATLWRAQDGNAEAFRQFCLDYFIAAPTDLQYTLARLETNLEIIGGHGVQVARDLSRPLQLEIGPVLPVDYLFAEYNPLAHVNEDLFKTKIAFVVLLNFANTSLAERMQQGLQWTRDQWAQTRLAQRFVERIPAEVNQALSTAYVQADDYIANYNIHMHQLVDDRGQQLFPAGLKLITHWGLRDELKAQYAKADGLARQRMIRAVMERIIAQEIPKVMIDNDSLLWNPVRNTLSSGAAITPESDRRYQLLLNIFQAEKQADAYFPQLSSKMARRFERDREIPEAQFEQLLTSVLTDPVALQVARLITRRLGRKLESFDIWYNGFKPASNYNEEELDRLLATRYPNTAALQADLVNILSKLGFDRETALFLSEKIAVDPSRGAGHALGAGRREDQAHLRTRIPADGMRYKGFNIAVHELGHCVEQVFSLNRIDHTLLAGVPNTAFTEAFAFVFQSRDLELLGLAQSDPLAEHLAALDTYWATCEIASVGLLDMRVWHWMYDHPQAGPAELKAAVMEMSRQIWNQFWAPLLGVRDSSLLAIYSHLIDSGLYLPDYSLGHIIMFQIEKYLQNKNLGREMERMCALGAITPDAWMRQAVGQPVSAEPLLQATRAAVQVVKR